MQQDPGLRQRTLEFLRANGVMFFGTANSDGAPHVAAMLYVVDDDFCFSFVTREDTSKARNLLENPRGSLSVGWEGQMNVQAWGPVERVEDEAQRRAIFAGLADVSAGLEDFWPPLVRINAGEYVVYRLRPERLRVLDLVSQRINEEELPLVDVIS